MPQFAASRLWVLGLGLRGMLGSPCVMQKNLNLNIEHFSHHSPCNSKYVFQVYICTFTDIYTNTRTHLWAIICDTHDVRGAGVFNRRCRDARTVRAHYCNLMSTEAHGFSDPLQDPRNWRIKNMEPPISPYVPQCGNGTIFFLGGFHALDIFGVYG